MATATAAGPRPDAAAIKKAMEGAGFSGLDLSKKLSVTERYLDGVILGRTSGSPSFRDRLAKALGVPLESIFQGDTSGPGVMPAVAAAGVVEAVAAETRLDADPEVGTMSVDASDDDGGEDNEDEDGSDPALSPPAFPFADRPEWKDLRPQLDDGGKSTPAAIGRRLLDARLESGKTPAAVAKTLGLDRKDVEEIEAGKSGKISSHVDFLQPFADLYDEGIAFLGTGLRPFRPLAEPAMKDKFFRCSLCHDKIDVNEGGGIGPAYSGGHSFHAARDCMHRAYAENRLWDLDTVAARIGKALLAARVPHDPLQPGLGLVTDRFATLDEFNEVIFAVQQATGVDRGWLLLGTGDPKGALACPHSLWSEAWRGADGKIVPWEDVREGADRTGWTRLRVCDDCGTSESAKTCDSCGKAAAWTMGDDPECEECGAKWHSGLGRFVPEKDHSEAASVAPPRVETPNERRLRETWRDLKESYDHQAELVDKIQAKLDKAEAERGRRFRLLRNVEEMATDMKIVLDDGADFTPRTIGQDVEGQQLIGGGEIGEDVFEEDDSDLAEADRQAEAVVGFDPAVPGSETTVEAIVASDGTILELHEQPFIPTSAGFASPPPEAGREEEEDGGGVVFDEEAVALIAEGEAAFTDEDLIEDLRYSRIEKRPEAEKEILADMAARGLVDPAGSDPDFPRPLTAPPAAATPPDAPVPSPEAVVDDAGPSGAVPSPVDSTHAEPLEIVSPAKKGAARKRTAQVADL